MTRFGRPGKRIAIVSAAAVALVLIALLGTGWYYSSLLRSGALTPDYSPDTLNLVVVSVDGDRIVLAEREGESVDDLDDDERWGLDAQSGYGQVGAVLEGGDGKVTRDFELITGSISPGDLARLDSFAFEGDPLAARGLDFRSVAVPSPSGELPAWKLDGDAGTWVVFVHGWRSDREEALRILPTVSELGLSSLVMTYRNDEEAPRSPDGLIRWGATEWQDLEAAVRYAESEGAESVILYGYSMGGGIAMRFLQQSEEARLVTGVVLDAPVLDFEALLSFQAGRRHVPGFIVSIGKQFAGWRFDIDWEAMNHLDHVERVEVPILLFHGDDDGRAPLGTSERLANERPDIVTFHVVEGAGHVRSWNADPEVYEESVREFISMVAAVPVR